MRYFAYGTNMNPDVMARKGLEYTGRQRAVLKSYGLRFNKRSGRQLLPPQIGFANIVPAPHESVEGVLYELPDVAQEKLDALERAPEHYERITVSVETDLGTGDCETYRAMPEHTAEGLVPSRSYINHILSARDMLSPSYTQRLDGMTTYAGQCVACHRSAVVLFLKEAGEMFTLCTPCSESRRIWGDAIGRRLSVRETEAIVQHLRQSKIGYTSVVELMADAARLDLLRSEPHR